MFQFVVENIFSLERVKLSCDSTRCDMELLAFTHASAAYTDLTPPPQLRSIDYHSIPLPNAAVMGATSVALAMLLQSPQALALNQQGDRGEAVRTLQIALIEAGFDLGEADGIFGEQTQAAVVAFQQQRNLTPDGIVGPLTEAALRGAAASEVSPQPASSQSSLVTAVYVATPDGIRVRATPNGDVIGYKPQGSQLLLTNQEQTSSGYRWVRLAGEPGWVAEEFLAPANNTARPTATTVATATERSPVPTSSQPGRAEVTATALVVRTAPNGQATGNTLLQGDIVELSGRVQLAGDRRWAELSTGRWVAADYLQPLQTN